MFEYDKNADINEIIKTMLLMKGTSLRKLSEKLEKSKDIKLSQSNISKKLQRGTIRFNEVKEIADILGYEIIIKEK